MKPGGMWGVCVFILKMRQSTRAPAREGRETDKNWEARNAITIFFGARPSHCSLSLTHTHRQCVSEAQRGKPRPIPGSLPFISCVCMWNHTVKDQTTTILFTYASLYVCGMGPCWAVPCSKQSHTHNFLPLSFLVLLLPLSGSFLTQVTIVSSWSFISFFLPIHFLPLAPGFTLLLLHSCSPPTRPSFPLPFASHPDFRLPSSSCS